MRKLTAIVIAVFFVSPALAQSSPATVTPSIDTTLDQTRAMHWPPRPPSR